MFSDLFEQVIRFKDSMGIFCLIEFFDVEHFQLSFVGDFAFNPKSIDFLLVMTPTLSFLFCLYEVTHSHIET